MVEYTSTKTSSELSSYGYKELGIYHNNSKELNDLIIKATIKNKIDLFLIVLDKTKEIYQVFLKTSDII